MSDFDLSNYPVLPAEPTGELREKLGRVKYVFTDLDATMLAPGSCALSDNEGNPSTALVEAIVALKRAGRPSWLSSAPASRSFHAPAALA